MRCTAAKLQIFLHSLTTPCVYKLWTFCPRSLCPLTLLTINIVDGNVLVYLQAFEQHILSSMAHLFLTGKGQPAMKLTRTWFRSKRVWLLDYWARWKCAQTDEQMMHILSDVYILLKTLHIMLKLLLNLGCIPTV